MSCILKITKKDGSYKEFDVGTTSEDFEARKDDIRRFLME